MLSNASLDGVLELGCDDLAEGVSNVHLFQQDLAVS